MPLIDGQYVGYCDESTLPIKQGDTVRIKKGTPLRSLHPTRIVERAARTYTVKVHHTMPGMTGFQGDEKGQHLDNPKVCWPGAGGYRVDCDINYAEKVG